MRKRKTQCFFCFCVFGVSWDVLAFFLWHWHFDSRYFPPWAELARKNVDVKTVTTIKNEMWSGDKLACRWFITINIFHSFITFHYFPFKESPRRRHDMVVWWSWSTLEWRIAAFRPSDVQSIIHTFTNYLTSICGMDCVLWRIHKFYSCSRIHHFTMSSCGYVRSYVYRSMWTFVKKKRRDEMELFSSIHVTLWCLWVNISFAFMRSAWDDLILPHFMEYRILIVSELKPIFIFTDSLDRFSLYSCFLVSYLIGSISMMIY